MGDQHYALVRVTGPVTAAEMQDFRDALAAYFRDVRDLFELGNGGLYLVYEEDFANCETELDMDNAVANLEGILSAEAEIVWSWDHPEISKQQDAACEEDRFPPRQRVWYIPGKVPS